jgi:hypothetical protein
MLPCISKVPWFFVTITTFFVKIKGYKDRIDLDSDGHVKVVRYGGLSQDDKNTLNTKLQQQSNSLKTPQKLHNNQNIKTSGSF